MPETSIVTYCWLGAWIQPKVAVYIEWLVLASYTNEHIRARVSTYTIRHLVFLLSIVTRLFSLFSGIFIFTVIANNYFYPSDTGKTGLCIYELISRPRWWCWFEIVKMAIVFHLWWRLQLRCAGNIDAFNGVFHFHKYCIQLLMASKHSICQKVRNTKENRYCVARV